MYAPTKPNAPLVGVTILLALGAGALACVLWVLPYRAFDLDRFFAPKELALHGAAFAAGLAALAGARRLWLGRADYALIAWLVLSMIAAIFATNHELAYRALTLSVSGAAVFWCARAAADAGYARPLSRVLALVVLLGAITALLQAYGVKMEFAALNRAPGGTFGNRNFMAHLTAAGIPLMLWCIGSARGKSGAIFWTAALAACAAALVLSRTRAAWLAIAVSAVLVTLVALRGPALMEDARGRRRLINAMAAVAAGIVLALILPNSLDWKSDSPYLDSVRGVADFRTGSGAGRLAQYANSAKMAAAHPLLGVGPGNWPVIYPKFAPSNDPSIAETTGMTANPWPSSDWVAALSERGVAAFLSLVAFVALLLGGALKARYDATRSPDERFAALAGGGVVLIAALEGGFDAVMLLPTPMIVVMASAGALIAAGSQMMEPPRPTPRRLLLTGSWTVFMYLACAFSARRIQAMRLYEIGGSVAIESALTKDHGSYRIQMRAAEFYLTRGQCEKARSHALIARDLFPYAPGPKRILAQCRS